MQEQQPQGPQQPRQGTGQGQGTTPAQQNNADERDAQIKAEPDTARLRSERQSVIDGGGEANSETP